MSRSYKADNNDFQFSAYNGDVLMYTDEIFSPVTLWESCYETASGTAASTTDDADKACASNGTADHTVDDLGSSVMFSDILVTGKRQPCFRWHESNSSHLCCRKQMYCFFQQ